MNKSRFVKVAFLILGVIALYLIALNGRYERMLNNNVLYDKWTGKVINVAKMASEQAEHDERIDAMIKKYQSDETE